MELQYILYNLKTIYKLHRDSSELPQESSNFFPFLILFYLIILPVDRLKIDIGLE